MKGAVSLAATIGAVVALLATIALGLDGSHDILTAERARFEALDETEREQAFGTLIPTRMDIFDFYRRNLRPDDRYYVQVTNDAFGQFADKATVVQNVARYYLAPAVAVGSPAEATVVLSYDADPGLLGLEYSEQVRAGLQVIFVSRLAS